MASFFHAYDLRGKHPEEIGKKEAKQVGKAYGTYLNSKEVLVGRDGRKHGEKITKAFIQGLKSTGKKVYNAGMVPTPVIYFGMIDQEIDASAVVTASHNPSEYTGFKFSKDNALAISREGGMKEIEEIYESKNFEQGNGQEEKIDVKTDYIDFIDQKIDLSKPLDIEINFGNGVTSEIGKRLFERLGCNVTAINQEINGEFPQHLPDPGNEEAQAALQSIMDEEDLGILFDGDGDRAGFIVPGYGYVEEDKVLALFAEQALNQRKGKIVHDLRASKLVKEKIEEFGGEAVESKVGHTFISEKIHEDEEIIFAGELSGHYYFPLWGLPFDDGIFAAALMCQMASETNLKNKLESYSRYPVSPELRIDCPEDAKKKVIEKISKEFSNHSLSTIDGVKIEFPNGWALVRPSNTEPKLSVRCEADTQEDLDSIRETVESKVRKFIKKSN